MSTTYQYFITMSLLLIGGGPLSLLCVADIVLFVTDFLAQVLQTLGAYYDYLRYVLPYTAPEGSNLRFVSFTQRIY